VTEYLNEQFSDRWIRLVVVVRRIGHCGHRTSLPLLHENDGVPREADNAQNEGERKRKERKKKDRYQGVFRGDNAEQKVSSGKWKKPEKRALTLSRVLEVPGGQAVMTFRFL
jgi:hypothetical protein